MTRQRILYVEDDPDVREAATILLEDHGYDVVAVPTAEAAIAELGGARFDLLVTDYRLPRENAAWLLRTARDRALLDGTPVIVVSAEEAPDGIDGYPFVRKPFGDAALLAAITAALR